MTPQPQSVDDYLAAQPADRLDALDRLRQTFLRAAPDAVESIRYGMPAYRLPNGHPVYFASWKRHTSLHDIPTLPQALEEQVATFRSGKDTLKFPADRPLPLDLIASILQAIASR